MYIDAAQIVFGGFVALAMFIVFIGFIWILATEDGDMF